MKIVTSQQMMEIDQKAAAAGIATEFLMENAGREVAREIRKFVDYIAAKNILIFAGPGNNGGDALVAARYLDEWGAKVSVYLLSDRSKQDKNLLLAKKQEIPLYFASKDQKGARLKNLLSSAEIVIDGILGTGRSRPIEGVFKEVLSMINQEKLKRPGMIIVAVDLPTGLNADTGEVDHSCPHTDLTITLGLPKPGLYNFPGAERAGHVVIADIGIPPELSKAIQTELITRDWARTALPLRPAYANKGTFGRVLAIVGSENYIGAAYLACMGAARVGAGLVTLATPKSVQAALAPKLTEITYAPLPESASGLQPEKAAAVITGYTALLQGGADGLRPGTASAYQRVREKSIPGPS